VLAQTEGEDSPIPPIPGFDIDTALCALNITRTPFDELNGNIQGFARGREIAVNPVAALPHKTTLHELAHVVLGHTTSEKLVDSEQIARHVCEVEAESVALTCCETLGLEGADFCRGYIQHFLKTEKEIPNHSAARCHFHSESGKPGGGQPIGCPRLRRCLHSRLRPVLTDYKGRAEARPLIFTADLSSYIANCAFRSQVFTCVVYSEFLLLTTSRTGVCSTWMPVGRENLYAGQGD